MPVITIQDKETLRFIKDTFNTHSDLFLKLLLFFAPLIMAAHLIGALLDPYYMNAEKYGRIASWIFLISLSYMWLTALIEKRPSINPVREINPKLFVFLVLAALCIFIPLELVKLTQWLFAIMDMHDTKYKFILKGLYIAAIYLMMRQSFILLGFIDGKIILPLDSIRMSRQYILPLFKSFVVYLLPLSILIFLYMYSLNYIVMKLELTEQGPMEAIFFSILYAPVFLLIHPFMVAFGATGLYIAYTQATSNETTSNAT